MCLTILFSNDKALCLDRKKGNMAITFSSLSRENEKQLQYWYTFPFIPGLTELLGKQSLPILQFTHSILAGVKCFHTGTRKRKTKPLILILRKARSPGLEVSRKIFQPLLPLIPDLIVCTGIMCLVWLRKGKAEEKGSVWKNMF